jgi:hypothetical protein
MIKPHERQNPGGVTYFLSLRNMLYRPYRAFYLFGEITTGCTRGYCDFAPLGLFKLDCKMKSRSGSDSQIINPNS